MNLIGSNEFLKQHLIYDWFMMDLISLQMMDSQFDKDSKLITCMLLA